MILAELGTYAPMSHSNRVPCRSARRGFLSGTTGKSSHAESRPWVAADVRRWDMDGRNQCEAPSHAGVWALFLRRSVSHQNSPP